MANLVTQKLKKYAPKFECEICDYNTVRKSSYDKHLATSKHKMLINGDGKSCKNVYTCDNCNRKYVSRNGLWSHKKQCVKNMISDGGSSGFENKDELIIELLKQNSELQKSLIKLSKDKSVTHNNTNNSHNKTFNLNFFLNETCKDALNITEFVSSIKPTLEELEYTGRQGYVAGISNIILKKLNSLEEYIRPIHCCDLKREVLYIKDNNHWTKETEEKPILTKAIKTIANENIKNIQEWRGLNPKCTDSDSQKNNLYLKIVSNSMSGLDKDETEKNTNKIISNVAKEVAILKGGGV
jgi:ribosomal protein L37AE/L43A